MSKTPFDQIATRYVTDPVFNTLVKRLVREMSKDEDGCAFTERDMKQALRFALVMAALPKDGR